MSLESAQAAITGPAARILALERIAIGGWTVAAAYAALTIAVLLPILSVDVVPLANLPNHMARIHILAQIDTNPALAQHYRVNWAMQPNLAVDVLLTPLARVVSPLELGRWFTVLTVLTTISGVLVLHRVLYGRVGLWPAAIFLFIYNHVLIWGFFNFLFGAGLALWMFAGWLATADRAGRWRALFFGVACLTMFFVHLFALAIYGVLVATWEVGRLRGRWRQWRRCAPEWGLAAAQFVPAAILYLVALPPAVAQPEMDWGGAVTRLRGLWSPVLTDMSPADAFIGLVVLFAVVAGVARRWLRPHPAMLFPLVGLTLLALVVPFWVYGRFGGVWGLDVRLWVVLAFVAVAAMRFEGPVPAARALALVGLTLLAVRLYQISDHWRVYDDQIREYREAARVIEPGAIIMQAQDRLLPVYGAPGSFRDVYFHLTNYSVVDRSVFLPTLFTDPAKQPVAAAPHLAEIDTPVGWPVSVGGLRAWADPAVFDWFDGDDQVGDQRQYGYMWQDRFDYVVVLFADAPSNPVPALLQPVASGSFFAIYRVRAGGCIGDYPGSCTALRAAGYGWSLPHASLR